jgi:hypothetical protein
MEIRQSFVDLLYGYHDEHPEFTHAVVTVNGGAYYATYVKSEQRAQEIAPEGAQVFKFEDE